MTRERVVIIGGGLSAMAAATALSDPKQGGRYDISVLQIGWRLGGKAASGVNPERNYRIEEHGLHLMFGCYHNTFAWMRDIYRELGRAPGAPLASFEEAFKARDETVLMENIDGAWKQWRVEFPRNADKPGQVPSPWTYLKLMLTWLERSVGEWLAELDPLGILDWPLVHRAEVLVEHVLDRLFSPLRQPLLRSLTGPAMLLKVLVRLIAKIEAFAVHDRRQHFRHVTAVIDLLVHALWKRVGSRVHVHAEDRHRWVLVYLAATVVKGVLADDLVAHGFASVDDEDLRAWFYRHAALTSPDAKFANDLAFCSPPVQALYDAAFAYRGGDPKQPTMAAGTGLRIALRLIFGYTGSVVFEMQAGMGDTIFAPVYQVLKARGVKFKFFQRVRALELNDSKSEIARIRISQQVELQQESYDPLVMVDGLPCWPSRPKYELIRNGDALRDSGANLELYSADWQDCGGDYVLNAEHDFDHVVLAVGHACLPMLCAELVAANRAFATMSARIESVQTQALQLWMTPTLKQLGWPRSPVVIGSYAEPYSSLADFTHLLAREQWPRDERPQHLMYYTCGVLPTLANGGEGQREAEARVSAAVHRLLEDEIAPVFPGGTNPLRPSGLDFSKLHARQLLVGAARVGDQYLRANVDPVERYELSVPGSQRARLRTDASGFKRLFLAGTWIDTGLNISACETAVMSGLQAARAVSGLPTHVIGEHDLEDTI